MSILLMWLTRWYLAMWAMCGWPHWTPAELARMQRAAGWDQ